ncbi:MAG: tetratricopeptide repeat protein [Flavobacteriales bacterium]
MKLPLFLCFVLPLSAFAQLYNGASLPFFECEDQWVYFKRSSDDSLYHYGFVFLDEQSGFTLNHEGEFRILPSGRWEALPHDTAYNTKIRLSATHLRVALMSADKRLDLNLPPVPDWLELYKFDTGSVRSLIRRGYHCNHVGASHRALVELLTAYQVDPQAIGLAYELAYAHNHLENYGKAIDVIERSIRYNGNDAMLYRELAYALAGLGKYGQAEITSRAGIEVCNDNDNRAEIAVHMAGVWYNVGDEKKFREWASIARAFAAPDSPFIEHLSNYETEIDNR